MLFWIITAALVAILALLFVLAVLRGAQNGAAETPASYDMQVYRAQLRELDRDVERGVTSKEEAGRTKIEIARRMLEADRKVQACSDPGRAPKGANLALAVAGVVLAGAAFWLYGRMGAQGYADQPIAMRIADANRLYESRPDQEKAEKLVRARLADNLPGVDPNFAELMDKLRAAVAKNPDDPEGLELLARNEAATGHFDAAWKAQKRLITIKGDGATAGDYARLGELMVVAAGGLITPEAERAFATALRKDPGNGLSLYYIGLMMAQNQRGDRAFRIWDGLLRNSQPSDPWVPMIEQNIRELAWLAGEARYTPPVPRSPGPSQQDIANAARMSPEDRQQMIQGMVDGLFDRLTTSGGTSAEWVRVITSFVTLGEVGRAREAWSAAQQALADQPDALAQVQRAARKAGVSE